MKINRGKDMSINSSLIFAATKPGEEDLILIDEITLIKVTTDDTDFDKVVEGFFGYVDDQTICVGNQMIPIEYIEEIEIID